MANPLPMSSQGFGGRSRSRSAAVHILPFAPDANVLSVVGALQDLDTTGEMPNHCDRRNSEGSSWPWESNRLSRAEVSDRVRTISEFLKTQAAALRRIAGATRGDMSVEDVKQEAWLVAVDIEQRRGYPVDFGDPGDQEFLLKWLYCKLVRFAEKQMRHAVRIDKDWDRENAEIAASALARLLTSPLESDPLVRLQQAEDETDFAKIARRSYSEASAYVLLLIRFDWDVDELAADLRVAVQTLRKRLRVCGIKAKVQPSLFDGLDVIDPAFEPRRARRFSMRRLVEAVVHQRCWSFG